MVELLFPGQYDAAAVKEIEVLQTKLELFVKNYEIKLHGSGQLRVRPIEGANAIALTSNSRETDYTITFRGADFPDAKLARITKIYTAGFIARLDDVEYIFTIRPNTFDLGPQTLYPLTDSSGNNLKDLEKLALDLHYASCEGINTKINGCYVKFPMQDS